MALIKKQLLAKEDMLLSADNTPVSQARAGTIISVHPVNASVIPFDETKSIVEAVEDLAYTHPSKHPVSIIDGSSNPSKFVKTDTLGNTGFDIVTWAEVAGKPNTYTPNSHEHSLDEVTSGTLPASRIAVSETRQFITAERASQLLDMEVKSNKGMPNGYAPLDSNGKINPSFLSALNLVEVFTPTDLASMLALTSAQPGDIAYRQDNSTSYMLVALPASTEANWKSLNTGSQVISVNGQTGVVSLNTSNIAESTNLYFTNERVNDRVANLLQAGTNISLAYDDTSNTLTINANDTSVDWSEVQSKPTTISGYSITDAYTKTETNSALSLKAPLASPTFTGTVALPSTTSIGNVSSTELGYLDGVTSSIQTQFNGKVSKTGDETIAGVKTFSSNPISSATQSTAANALTRKDYVDGLDSANVKRTGDETIAGIKTFSSSPIVPTPTAGTQAVNKDYADTKVTKVVSTDNAIARYDGTTGELQNSGVIIDDSGNITASNSGSTYGGSEAFSIKYSEGQKVNVLSSARSTSAWSIGFGVKPSSTTPGEFISTVDNAAWTRGALLIENTLKFLSAPAQNTAVGSTVNLTEVFRTTPSGDLLLTSGTGVLGYGTGSGGTVTQLTSKSTAVTLNKPCGRITMHNAALAAGVTVCFVLFNNLMGSSDTLTLSIPNLIDNDIFNYKVTNNLYNGGAAIFVTNVSGSTLSEAISINFNVHKGALA